MNASAFTGICLTRHIAASSLYCLFVWVGGFGFFPLPNAPHFLMEYQKAFGVKINKMLISSYKQHSTRLISNNLPRHNYLYSSLCWHSISDEMKQKMYNDYLLQELYIRLRQLQQNSHMRFLRCDGPFIFPLLFI